MNSRTARLQPVRPLRITVLAGGPSSEREVSLASGRNITQALASLGHQVQMLDISADDLAALDVPADVIFPALHGRFGEDGEVQTILEARGLPYVGCGPAASALAMDKMATKRAAARADIPVADDQLVTPDQRDDAVRRWSATRVIIKPVDQGSSVDVHIAPDQMALSEALDRLLDKYGQAMVERFIAGPELAVGVLGEQVLPVVQIIPQPQRAFYDYQAKYQDNHTQYIVNPPLGADRLGRIQDMTGTVFRALGCRDLSRIDWLIDEATGRPYLLEVNTLPGFTSHSILPKAAAAIGVDYPSLCQTLVEMAMGRGRQADRT